MNREQDLENLKALGHKQQCTVAWPEGGGGEVHYIWDTYFLYSIPQYGGEGAFEGLFTDMDFEEILDIAYSWT